MAVPYSYCSDIPVGNHHKHNPMHDGLLKPIYQLSLLTVDVKDKKRFQMQI